MASTLKRHPSDSDNDECPLTSDEASNSCKKFASITNTDTALAMMILQENKWNLEHALCSYLDSTEDRTKYPSEQIVYNHHQTSSVFFCEYQIEVFYSSLITVSHP
jgi:hypothetical protein